MENMKQLNLSMPQNGLSPEHITKQTLLEIKAMKIALFILVLVALTGCTTLPASSTNPYNMIRSQVDVVNPGFIYTNY
jgi:hypothetical protein